MDLLDESSRSRSTRPRIGEIKRSRHHPKRGDFRAGWNMFELGFCRVLYDGLFLLRDSYRGYNKRIRPDADFSRGLGALRTPIMAYFQESVGYCFDAALESMGAPIREWVYDFLEKRGIVREEIPSRFGDVVKTLLDRLGTSARVIAYRTMLQLYQQFSLSPDFDYQDSLPDRFTLLRDRVITDRLYPKIIKNTIQNGRL